MQTPQMQFQWPPFAHALRFMAYLSLHSCFVDAAANLDGKGIPAGSFVELKDGQELEFEDGKRYVVRMDGEGF